MYITALTITATFTILNVLLTVCTLQRFYPISRPQQTWRFSSKLKDILFESQIICIFINKTTFSYICSFIRFFRFITSSPPFIIFIYFFIRNLSFPISQVNFSQFLATSFNSSFFLSHFLTHHFLYKLYFLDCCSNFSFPIFHFVFSLLKFLFTLVKILRKGMVCFEKSQFELNKSRQYKLLCIGLNQ